MDIKTIQRYRPPTYQPDATISRVNPVSGTRYVVLTEPDCRLICAFANITWGVTQPTTLVIVITVDGEEMAHVQANPVSATNYGAVISGDQPRTNQGMEQAAAGSSEKHKPFLYEGKYIKVEVVTDWAVNQPTPLVCRVKWAYWTE